MYISASRHQMDSTKIEIIEIDKNQEKFTIKIASDSLEYKIIADKKYMDEVLYILKSIKEADFKEWDERELHTRMGSILASKGVDTCGDVRFSICIFATPITWYMSFYTYADVNRVRKMLEGVLT